MTDPQYIRVNVSTATSTPRYDEYGRRIAEVDMMLPSNFVGEADRIKKARMAVMKLQTPLSCLPGPVLDTVLNTSPDIGQLVDSFVVLSPKRFLSSGLIGSNSGGDLFAAANVSTGGALTFPLNHYYEGFRLPSGRWSNYHLPSIQDLFAALNRALSFKQSTLWASARTQGTTFGPMFTFVVNSDDTISLRVKIQHPQYQAYPSTFWSRSDPTHTSVKRTFVHGWDEIEHYSRECVIAVSDNVAKLLPTLPWLRVQKINALDFPTSLVDQGGYYNVLRTDLAHVSIEKGVNSFRAQIPDPDDPETTIVKEYSTDTIVYHFDSSDAVALTGVNCIVLGMNGAAFNQQVFPVNMSAETMAAAQTTTVPILEVYYPLWSKPSDLTTNLVVVKDVFSDAAPVNINPQLLKERSIKFKLYYITSAGELKEFKIPSILPFSFQLCFELTY